MEIKSSRTVFDGVKAIKEAEYFVDPSQAGHIMRVLREMYENPVRAAIREYGANAQDAHTQAGLRGTPFEVWAPSNMNPTLRIRDFGPGLPHEAPDGQDVVHLLLGFGSSGEHKRSGASARHQIGGFGIGCKSAFAVTDSFTYHVYHAGRHRTYLCYLDEHDKGCSKLVFDRPTTEHPGIEVEIPVAQDQMGLFTGELKTAFSFFDPAPILHGVVSQRPPETHLLRSSDDHSSKAIAGKLAVPWKLLGRETDIPGCSSALGVVMGGIIYPIRDGVLFRDKSSGDRVNALMGKYKLILYAGIGDFDLAPSRETLQYSKHTIRLLETLLADIAERCIPAQIQPQLDASADKLAALDLFMNLCQQELLQVEHRAIRMQERKERCPTKVTDALNNKCKFRAAPDRNSHNSISEEPVFKYRGNTYSIYDTMFVPQSFLDQHKLQVCVLRASRGRYRHNNAASGLRYVPVVGLWDQFLYALQQVDPANKHTHPWPSLLWPRKNTAVDSEITFNSTGNRWDCPLCVDWTAAETVAYQNHADMGPGFSFHHGFSVRRGTYTENRILLLGSLPVTKNTPAFLRHWVFTDPGPAKYSRKEVVWITGPDAGLDAFTKEYLRLLGVSNLTEDLRTVSWAPPVKTPRKNNTAGTSATAPAGQVNIKAPVNAGGIAHIDKDFSPVPKDEIKALNGLTAYYIETHRKLPADAWACKLLGGDSSNQSFVDKSQAAWSLFHAACPTGVPPLYATYRGGDKPSIEDIKKRYPGTQWVPAHSVFADLAVELYAGPKSMDVNGGARGLLFQALVNAGNARHQTYYAEAPSFITFITLHALKPVLSEDECKALDAVAYAWLRIMDKSHVSARKNWPAGSPVSGLFTAIEQLFPVDKRSQYISMADVFGYLSTTVSDEIEKHIGSLTLSKETMTTKDLADTQKLRNAMGACVKPVAAAAVPLIKPLLVLAHSNNTDACSSVWEWCGSNKLW